MLIIKHTKLFASWALKCEQIDRRRYISRKNLSNLSFWIYFHIFQLWAMFLNWYLVRYILRIKKVMWFQEGLNRYTLICKRFCTTHLAMAQRMAESINWLHLYAKTYQLNFPTTNRIGGCWNLSDDFIEFFHNYWFQSLKKSF